VSIKYSIISSLNFLSRLSRQIPVKDYRNLKLSESKDLGYIGLNNTIPKKVLFLVMPLPLVEEAKDKDKKPKAPDVIEFVLKQRAGSTATAPTYKLQVTRLCKGTVAEWNDLVKQLKTLEIKRHK
jgi:hypothetical protein